MRRPASSAFRPAACRTSLIALKDSTGAKTSMESSPKTTSSAPASTAVSKSFSRSTPRAGFGHRAARLRQGMAQLGHRPVAVVGDDFHHDRHAVWGVTFIEDALERGGILVFTGAALDRPFDVVLRQ